MTRCNAVAPKLLMKAGYAFQTLAICFEIFMGMVIHQCLVSADNVVWFKTQVMAEYQHLVDIVFRDEMVGGGMVRKNKMCIFCIQCRQLVILIILNKRSDQIYSACRFSYP